LADQARARPWVPTHGEPHTANQLLTPDGLVLVDWESLASAPRERDLRALVESGYADLVPPDWAMIEMFDLEWRLDEIAGYAAWFAAPHRGGEDDRIAFQGLLDELDRP
jgi:spectinomycin phosphotransferase